jgi:hypothetical protein
MKKIILTFSFFLFFFFNLVFIISGISLLQPKDLTVFSDTQSVTFICNVSAPSDLSNVTLYVNDSVIDYNSCGINEINYTFVKNIPEGFWIWTCSYTTIGAGERKDLEGLKFTINTLGPYSSENSTNSTSAGKAIMHRLYFQDNNGLGGYIFSFDNGDGIFVNNSWMPFSGSSNWSNVTMVVNSTGGTTIRWRVYANDYFGKLNASKIYSYTLIDSNLPSVSLSSPEDKTTLKSTSIDFLCSTSDDTLLSNVSLYGNWTGSWRLNETKSITGTSNSTLFSSKVVVANTNYLWACYVCDSLGNCGFSSENRTFIVDTIPPKIDLVSPLKDIETTITSQKFEFIVTDNIDSELKSCSLYIDNALKENKILVEKDKKIYFSSINLLSSSLGVNYKWYIKCYDFAGNYVDSPIWRLTIISEEEEAAFWDSTYFPSSSEFLRKEGYVSELTNQSRIKLVISNSNHYIGIVDLNSTTAVINISSTPQQAIFSKGDEKKFDVNGNGYYDIWIKLNSITSSKANVSIKTIHEQISPKTKDNLLNFFKNSDKEDNLYFYQEQKQVLDGEKILFLIVMVIILIICFVIIFVYIHKRKKEFSYS